MNLNENKIKEELFLKGLTSFKNFKFYDAHEYWEDLWSDYHLKDAKFIQALIQLSVGYFHITNNNKNGALGLLRKCKPKFEKYKPQCRGIDVDHIIHGQFTIMYRDSSIKVIAFLANTKTHDKIPLMREKYPLAELSDISCISII